MRKLVLAAIEDTGQKELEFIPTPAMLHPLSDPEYQLPAHDCEDFSEWEWMLEALENYVLWDADYAMDYLFMDLDAETSRRRRQKLGINDNYYAAIAPDPADAERSADCGCACNGLRRERVYTSGWLAISGGRSTQPRRGISQSRSRRYATRKLLQAIVNRTTSPFGEVPS